MPARVGLRVLGIRGGGDAGRLVPSRRDSAAGGPQEARTLRRAESAGLAPGPPWRAEGCCAPLNRSPWGRLGAGAEFRDFYRAARLGRAVGRQGHLPARRPSTPSLWAPLAHRPQKVADHQRVQVAAPGLPTRRHAPRRVVRQVLPKDPGRGVALFADDPQGDVSPGGVGGRPAPGAVEGGEGAVAQVDGQDAAVVPLLVKRPCPTCA